MEENKATRPKRVRKKSVPKVSQPEPLEVKTENTYAKKTKIGEPTIGRTDNYVSRVGLGNLTVLDNGQRTYL